MNFAKEIAGLPGLMKTSAEQLRKVPALTGTAMLTALNVVVGTPVSYTHLIRTIPKKAIAYRNTMDSSALITNVIAIAQTSVNGARTHIRSTI